MDKLFFHRDAYAMTARWMPLLTALALSLPHVSHAQDYLFERARDFADIFRARVAVPEEPSSFALKVRATSLLQLGAVRFDGRLYGMDQRQMGPWDQTRREVGASLLYFSSVQSEPWTPECPTGERAYDPDFLHYNGWDDGRNRPFSLGLMVQPFFLPGVDLGLYPSEAVDFALGLVGVDMLKDDRLAPPAQLPNPLMPGEPYFRDARDFQLPEEFVEDLEPFVFESSPAAVKARE